MKKTIITESLSKKVFTKSEIRYIVAQGWPFAIPSTVPDGCAYKYRGWGHTATVLEVTVTTKEQEAAYLKNFNNRAKSLRKRFTVDADAWCKEVDARAAEVKRAKKIEDEIDAMLTADGMWGLRSTIYELRTGDNVGTLTARYADVNSVTCTEVMDWNGYSRRCKWAKVTRSFTLNIRRGWHLFHIGGLLTFIKGGSVIREGMACEWIEQGKAISDIRTVKGYLVRGEHIEAKSLKEAKAINAEHRAMKLARLLSARKRAERRAEQKANGSLMITFQDSINSGNCRPGTMEFKHRYEAAIGHEAKSISIADLRKYGKLFGVEYYAEQAIQYALNH